jgi:hypothetical protein
VPNYPFDLVEKKMMTETLCGRSSVVIEWTSEIESKIRFEIASIIQGMTPASCLDAADITGEVIREVLSHACRLDDVIDVPPR